MASLRFKVGGINVSVGSTGVRLGTKIAGTLVSTRVLSFAKSKTQKGGTKTHG